MASVQNSRRQCHVFHSYGILGPAASRSGRTELYSCSSSPSAVCCIHCLQPLTVYIFLMILHSCKISIKFIHLKTCLKCDHQHTNKPLTKDEVFHTDDKIIRVSRLYSAQRYGCYRASVRSRYRYYPSTLKEYRRQGW